MHATRAEPGHRNKFDGRLMRSPPKVSFVISTRNRCEVLLATLAQVHRCGLATGEFDIHVVDNASTDGTVARVRAAFPNIHLIASKTNGGSVAKNLALPHALGRYVVFLDDDSYPAAGSIARMIQHFDADAQLGAATFTVELPDGSQECSAYPDVFIGCGVGLRRRALRLVGGLPDDFFMQAEEYDLSLRLLDGGWKVCRFEDLKVHHLKTPRARVSSRTMRLDVRNNLYLILRRFPRKWIVPYSWDWMRRYAWIAASKGQTGPYICGLIEGLLRSAARPRRGAISEEAFELFAKLDQTQRLLSLSLGERFGEGMERRNASNCLDDIYHEASATHVAASADSENERLPTLHPFTQPLPEGEGPERASRCLRPLERRRVVLVDCGKNIHAYWRACQNLGVYVVAIADPKLAHPSRRYRGIPIVDDATARTMNYDLVVIANQSPVHARVRRDAWKLAQRKPVVDLLEQVGLSRGAAIDSLTSGHRVSSGSRRTAARSA